MNKPKLLYLAYYFPPAKAVACVRTKNTAMHLARLGWDVTVVTPRPDIWRSKDAGPEIREQLDEAGVKRLETGHGLRFLNNGPLACANTGLPRLLGAATRLAARHLDVNAAIGWDREVERACAGIKPGEFDVILSTGTPFSVFDLARRLALRLDCPYVLDYRDGWTTGDPHPIRSGPPRPWTVRTERKVLENAAAVTIISPSNARALVEGFDVGDKLYVLWNGFDADELGRVPRHEFDHFAIVYAGNFYFPLRAITPVMAALGQLSKSTSSDDPPWQFHYYGTAEAHIREEASRFGVTDRVVLHGSVPRDEAVAANRGAGVSVVIASIGSAGTLAEKGIITGKIFEPLGLGTPILAVAPEGSDLETVFDIAGGGRCYHGQNIDGMAQYIADAIRGQVPEIRSPEGFSWPNLARSMDCLLRKVANIPLDPPAEFSECSASRPFSEF